MKPRRDKERERPTDLDVAADGQFLVEGLLARGVQVTLNTVSRAADVLCPGC